MKCFKCGQEIEDNSKFCEFCGANISSFEEQEVNSDEEIDTIQEKVIEDEVEAETETEMIESTNKRQPMSIWKKIIIAVIGINIILITAGVIYLRNENDPEKTVTKFIEALSQSDYNKLTKVAVAKDANISITENSAKALFSLYNENSAIKSEVEKILNEELLKRKDKIASNKDAIVSLIEEKHMFYSSYKIGIQDYDVTVKANLDNVKVAGFNGEVKVDAKGKEVVVKDVLLGRYNIKGTSKDEYDVEYECEASSDIVANDSMDLEFQFTNIQIQKPQFEVLNVYINDKPYKNLSFKNDILTISPIPYDSVVKVECRTAWGAVLTSSYTANNHEENIFYPTFTLDEETRTTLMNLGCEFYKNMYSYYNDRDLDSLRKMNYRNDISVVNSFIDGIDYMESENMFGHRESTYTLSNLAADKSFITEDLNSGEFRIYIEASLEEKSVYYDSDGKLEDDSESTYNNNSGYVFTIKFIDGKWTVTSVDYDSYRDIENIYNFN